MKIKKFNENKNLNNLTENDLRNLLNSKICKEYFKK
jgi:hypothetical protein